MYAASAEIAIGYINSNLNDEPAIIIPTVGNGTAGKAYVVTDKFYTMIKSLNITAPIPLAFNGSYDLEKRLEIADRCKQIDVIKQGLINQKALYQR